MPNASGTEGTEPTDIKNAGKDLTPEDLTPEDLSPEGTELREDSEKGPTRNESNRNEVKDPTRTDGTMDAPTID
jgi:hypothetical protein